MGDVHRAVAELPLRRWGGDGFVVREQAAGVAIKGSRSLGYFYG